MSLYYFLLSLPSLGIARTSELCITLYGSELVGAQDVEASCLPPGFVGELTPLPARRKRHPARDLW
jgi:hypothetical protein